MKRFLGTVLASTGLIVLMAGLAIDRMSSRADAVEEVPVALINRDEPVTPEDGEQEQTVAAGRILAAEIVTGAETPLAWTVIDADAASLVETDYFAIVTIPEDFSAIISGLQDGDAERATITLEADDPTSPLAAQIVGEVTEASTAAFNDDVTSTYLETVYESYESISAAVSDATDGATALADSARQLADGTDELVSATSGLAAGAQSAAATSQSLSTGATDVAGGAADVAGGAGELSTSLRDAAAAATETLVPLASTTTARSAAAAATLTELAQSCPATAGSSYCAAVAAAAQEGIAAAQSAAATESTASGLSSGLTAASAATTQVATGAAEVSSGARSLAQGSEELAAALGGLASGADSVARSTDGVSSGAHGVADGAASLTDGLHQLEDSVPTYEETTHVDLADAVASPATVSLTGVSAGGPELFAAVAIALALWVGGAAMFARRPAVPPWTLAAGGRPVRAVAIGLAPRLALASLGALALWVLLLVLGVAGPSPGLLLILILLGAACLTTVLHALFAAAGRAGLLIAGVLGVIQLAATGLFAPIEMAGPTWQTVSELTPLSRLAQLARDVMLDNPIEPLSSAAVLALWTVLAIAVSITAARARGTRRRRTTA